MISLGALMPFARRGDAARARCDLCGSAMGGDHRHLVDKTERRLRCACAACALLFQHPGQRFVAAPDRWLYDPRLTLDDHAWAPLQIPVRLAFFFHHGGGARWNAFYPGPAGATESTLPLDAWRDFAAAVPLTGAVTPDLEALLVSIARERGECFLVPISACYELVGRVKRSWRGFDGGEEAWREIDDFFARVRARCEAWP
jgi:hypothetical protein